MTTKRNNISKLESDSDAASDFETACNALHAAAVAYAKSQTEGQLYTLRVAANEYTRCRNIAWMKGLSTR